MLINSLLLILVIFYIKKIYSINILCSVKNVTLPSIMSPQNPFLLPISRQSASLVPPGAGAEKQRRHSTPHQMMSSLCTSPLYEDESDTSTETAKSPLGDGSICSPIPRNSPMRSMLVNFALPTSKMSMLSLFFLCIFNLLLSQNAEMTCFLVQNCIVYRKSSNRNRRST